MGNDKAIPLRRVNVPAWGDMMVPRHIVRIDIDDPGRAGTHGWQVRYQKPSVFFSDAKNGKRRSPRTSLRAAIDCLLAIYRGPRRGVHRSERIRKRHPTGVPGVAFVRRRRPDRGFTEYLVRIQLGRHRQAGSVRRQIYLGTENTVSDARVRAALKKARGIREEWLVLRGPAAASRGKGS